MKKILVMSALVLAASAGGSFGQVLSTNVGNPQLTIPARPSPAPPITPRARGGVIPTAVRNGNPLQLLNPRAPARYGNSQEHVTTDPNDPGKPTGVKLFEWTF